MLLVSASGAELSTGDTFGRRGREVGVGGAACGWGGTAFGYVQFHTRVLTRPPPKLSNSFRGFTLGMN